MEIDSSKANPSSGIWPEHAGTRATDKRGVASAADVPWKLRLARNPLSNLALLIATLITTTWAGAAYQGVDLWRDPGNWMVGIPYALALLLILSVHEMGHYAAAKYHRVRVSLPYFIPMPFALGTLGAFIRMEQEPEERRKMFDIAVAGPLAGLAAALGVLAVGLVEASGPSAGPSVDPTSSLLLGLVAKAIGQDTAMLASDPLVFAGWLGLMLTAFNLLPIGQLDGGHMARALFGPRTATWMGRLTLGALVLLGAFVWHGFLLWALVAFAVGGGGPATGHGQHAADDKLLPDLRRHALGTAAFVLIALILIPMPGATSSLAASACPWL